MNDDARERVVRAVNAIVAAAKALPIPGASKGDIVAALRALDVAQDEYSDAVIEYVKALEPHS